jgi:hypothetical protein
VNLDASLKAGSTRATATRIVVYAAWADEE